MKRRMNGEGTIYFDEKRKLWIGEKKINGKRRKVSSKSQKELKEKLKNLENNLVTTSTITLLQMAEKNEKDKLAANITSEGTYYRNTATLKHIKNSNIANIAISKITAEQIQFFLNTKLNLSQSLINKMYNMIDEAVKKAIKENIILKNPMLNVERPTSNQDLKEVIAFEVQEQKQLIDHILSNQLIQNEKSKYDNITIKNLILLGLFTGMRIGELGAIDYNWGIDMENECFKITRTLTKDINGKIIIGTTTKTGKRLKKIGKKDIKIIPFNSYDKDFIITIIEEQKALSASVEKNNNNLLFCRKDGSPIVHNEINNLFKRICREAGIKLELKKGCHIHMLRHTFITRCIEARLELITIAKLVGHTTTKQIEQTYGHILDKFRSTQLETLNKYYIKENIVFIEKFQHKKDA